MDENREHLSTRRDSLVKAGGLVVAAIGAKSFLSDGASAATDGTGPAAVATGAVACVLTPEMTEGPYYLPGEKVRRNITEGRPGTPLTLKLKVVNVSTCKAIKGAAVDIWHADAGGTYSGVQDSVGTTFMRGIQPTDAKGVAQFLTVYPGWYQGRTVHIHVKVHLGGNVVHTGPALLPRHAHGHRVQGRALQRARLAGHPERERLDLRQRRQALDARDGPQRLGLRRRDHDGRPPLLARLVVEPPRGSRRLRAARVQARLAL